MAGVSRRTALVVAKAYSRAFTRTVLTRTYQEEQRINSDALHDYLFNEDYPPKLVSIFAGFWQPRKMEEFIMYLQEGQSVQHFAPASDDYARKLIGHETLRLLGGTILRFMEQVMKEAPLETVKDVQEYYDSLLRLFELDGFQFLEGRLIPMESDSKPAEEERKGIQVLYAALSLPNEVLLKTDLQTAEEHYLNGKWDDCVSNVRQVLELVLKDVARDTVTKLGYPPISDVDLKKPVMVRNHLEKNGLLGKDEMQTINSSYGFMSGVGSHPALGRQDQARLMRRMGMLLAEFVLIRYKEKLAGTP